LVFARCERFGVGMGERGHGQRGGRGVTRYVEAVLLGLLAEAPAHGYDLNERLAGLFPLRDSLPDVSTVYRALGDLEAQGAIRSSWADGAGGGRKVYELTDAGDDLLQFWIDRFEEEQTGVARFLGIVRKSVRSRGLKSPAADKGSRSGRTAHDG
ncbi:MAG: PadR family transcriptional regulator, partial [Actinobacteria bacterium]|nr:PadR family transcriptional regulator [Actinomycetota bacterium]